MATSPTRKSIMLKSNDSKLFLVSETVASQFQTLRQTIEEKGPPNTIMVPQFDSIILAKVIEYCQRHEDDANSATWSSSKKTELEKWDQQFLSNDLGTILQLLDAAHHLGIGKLYDAIVENI